MKKKTVFITKDGREFKDELEAEKYEKTLKLEEKKLMLK